MLELSFLILKQLHEFPLPLLAGNIRRGAEMRIRHEQTVAVQRHHLGVWGRIFHAAKIRFLGIRQKAAGNRHKAIGNRKKCIFAV